MNRIGPKTRLARRIGEALRDKDAKYLVKRNYPPGMHGQARVRKSEYALQLLEKQKAKWTYLVNERQFRKYVELASRKKELTTEMLIQLLELRLDNVVYRLGLASSRAAARQLVSHGFITVNGKRVNIPSFRVTVGDQLGIVESKKRSKYVQMLAPKLKQYKTQEWLELHSADMTGKILSAPNKDLTGTTIRLELIVEHYSR